MAFYLKTCLQKLTLTNNATLHLRKYARWNHRRPKRVLTAEEFDELENKFLQKDKTKENQKEIRGENEFVQESQDFISESKRFVNDSEHWNNQGKHFVNESEHFVGKRFNDNTQFKQNEQLKRNKQFDGNKKFIKENKEYSDNEEFSDKDKYSDDENAVQKRQFKQKIHNKYETSTKERYGNHERQSTREITSRKKQKDDTPKIKWRQPQIELNNSVKRQFSDGSNILDTDEPEEIKDVAKYRPLKKAAQVNMLETVVDGEGNLVYTKMKDNDSRIGMLFVTIKSKKEKDKNDLILLEGKRLIKDALESGCRLKYLIFSRKTDVEHLLPLLPKSGASIYKIPYREIQMWSSLTTSPGIMGIFKTPESHKIAPPTDHLPLTIICDNIREPGNLGAVIRSSAAVSCEKLLLTNGCVNLWDTKVTRSSSGAHFKVQIHKKLDWNGIRALIPPNAKVYIADNKIITSSAQETGHKQRPVQSTAQDLLNDALGNENLGNDRFRNENLLNENLLNENLSNENLSNGNLSNENVINQDLINGASENMGEPKTNYHLLDILENMPILPYYSVNFNETRPIVLIIGGETEGISEESYKFAHDRHGVRLNIPLSSGIDSLNTGTALGIISFEIKRQLMTNCARDNYEFANINI